MPTVASVKLLGRITVLRRCSLLLYRVWRGLSVVLFVDTVGRSVSVVIPAKTAEPLKMPFMTWTQVRPQRTTY